ncbi:MAG: hypothetical protein J5766_03565 [Clostridia bacterium]|nr:hypothetical protein [Clostridia bacterium]
MAKENRVGVSIRRTADEVKNYRKWMRLIPIAIGIAILLLITGYVISVLYMRYGAFTVSVNKFDHNNYALTLSDSIDFDSKTSRLNAEISETVTNIDGERDLPDGLDNIDGEHNGENYVAYTFYCSNRGKKTLTYEYEMYIANMTYEIEKAVRVRLYVEDPKDKSSKTVVTYAYPRTDGVDGPEPGTVAFKSGKIITNDQVANFKPGDTTKFTVVIWLEGPDPDCVDKILGGKFKIDMEINVLSAGDNEDKA